MKELDDLKKEFLEDFGVVNIDQNSINDLKSKYIGRSGILKAAIKSISSYGGSDISDKGKKINEIKSFVEDKLKELLKKLDQKKLKENFDHGFNDISLPFSKRGSLHPVSLVRNIIVKEFKKLGFSIIDGPELDYDYYNFLALNFPDNHPSRDMQDTFYIKDNSNLLLRTHTSNLQIHYMLENEPPIRIAGPGRVFRCDFDLTHTPMFHQIEAFVIDRNINFSHLKGTINILMSAIFKKKIKTRFRPSYFPFVSLGAEVDIECSICGQKGCRLCKGTGWIEVVGCGMIHSNVFENMHYDSDKYSGFAFGFGIDRIAMLKYGLHDLRVLFKNNIEFLNQFPIEEY